MFSFVKQLKHLLLKWLQLNVLLLTEGSAFYLRFLLLKQTEHSQRCLAVQFTLPVRSKAQGFIIHSASVK